MEEMAFPQGNAMAGGNSGGMTLRDWFAGQALTGAFTKETDEALQGLLDQRGVHPDKLRAIYCYEVADSMLAAREAK